MSIQEEVMRAIGPAGCFRNHLRGRLAGYGQDELDCTVNALLRAQRLNESSFGWLELIASKRVVGDMPHTGRPPNAVPSAEEEAAASLQAVLRQCKQCLFPQPLCEFRPLKNLGSAMRAEVCNTCHGKATGNGMAKRRGQVAKPVDSNATPGTVPSTEPSAVPDEGSGSPELRTIHVPQIQVFTAAQNPMSVPDYAKPVVPTALDNAQARLARAANRITVAEVDLANARAEWERCQKFIQDYQEFETAAN